MVKYFWCIELHFLNVAITYQKSYIMSSTNEIRYIPKAIICKYQSRYWLGITIVEIRWAIPCLICIKVFFVNERFMQNTQKILGLSHIAFSLYHIEEMTRRHFSSICSLFVLYIHSIKLHDVNYCFWCTHCTYNMFKLAPPDI